MLLTEIVIHLVCALLGISVYRNAQEALVLGPEHGEEVM